MKTNRSLSTEGQTLTERESKVPRQFQSYGLSLYFMNLSNGRQILDCASPLALFAQWRVRKRQRAAAVHDAPAPTRIPSGSGPPCAIWESSKLPVGLRSCLFLAALVLGAVLFAGCSANSSNEFQGYIEGEYVYVASPLGGGLTNLAVARGDEVKTGQLLFELERGSEAAAVQQAEKNLAQAQAQLDDLNKGKRPTEIASLEAQLERARANLKLAAADFGRREKLGGEDVISREELDQARAQRDADEAQVDQLTADLETARLGGREDVVRAAQDAVASQKAALDKARWSFDQKEQFAPTNAFVQDTLYRTAEWVAAGNPVVELLPPANIKVRFFVPETALPRIHTGQTVSVSFDGGPHAYSATVNYISTQAEFTPPVIYSRENRAKLVYMIEAKFSPADAMNLRPGQPVVVELK